MAIITSIATADVRWMLAGGSDAIVAGAARADDLGVINRRRWNPQRTVVAVFADIGGLYVGRALAGGGGAVVTADAVTRDAGMIKASR